MYVRLQSLRRANEELCMIRTKNFILGLIASASFFAVCNVKPFIPETILVSTVGPAIALNVAERSGLPVISGAAKKVKAGISKVIETIW